MNYDTIVSHFCEKKLYPYQPEYINAISALYISYISFTNLQKSNLYNNI